MPDLAWTEALWEARGLVLENDKAPRELKDAMEEFGDKDAEMPEDTATGVDFKVIRQLSTWLQSLPEDSRPKKVYVHELVQGSLFAFEPVKAPERSPELVARLALLQKQQFEREYRQMVSNVDGRGKGKSIKIGGVDWQDDIREIRTDMGAVTDVANVLFSAIGVFVAAYVAALSISSDAGVRSLFALVCSIIVVVAEVWLYAKYGQLGGSIDTQVKPKKKDVPIERHVIATYSTDEPVESLKKEGLEVRKSFAALTKSKQTASDKKQD